jgi:hypothetical protein
VGLEGGVVGGEVKVLAPLQDARLQVKRHDAACGAGWGGGMLAFGEDGDAERDGV